MLRKKDVANDSAEDLKRMVDNIEKGLPLGGLSLLKEGELRMERYLENQVKKDAEEKKPSGMQSILKQGSTSSHEDAVQNKTTKELGR